ncbi:glycosyltransferase family 2 protein [Streptomyces sp. NPDC093225]|uniref:glycosyltransferase family 2 protein n=1 Tax=Streptomyces sp. NPDC093225 TaxID=3366034 RepID=UPI00383026C4
MSNVLPQHPGGTEGSTRKDGSVAVVVIAYNDAGLVAEAVRSALAQGPDVREVVAVNDRSSDGTGQVLDELAAAHPRVRVIHRTENSGGCGTPRNDGIAAATAPYVLFLDSDDVLPQGAVAALLRAARAHEAPVTVGACVRRELPQQHDVPWVPGLYRAAPMVVERPADMPELVRDTLCVNKLYERAFLDKHAIRFPDGRFVYEDFVFTAQVLAAAPRIAVVPDLVYVWHVRRSAAQVSISLDRKDIGNWRARVEAHRRAVEILRSSGAPDAETMVHACRVKFLEYDLRMYLRELGTDPGYQAEWWTLTRTYLEGFEPAEIAAADASARWIVNVLRATDTPPADVDRLVRFAADPPRLVPPYARAADGTAVWSEALPGAVLDGLDELPPAALPVTADGELLTGIDGQVKVRVHDLYGRLAAARPRTARLEFSTRRGDEPTVARPVALTPQADGTWTALLPVGLTALASAGRRGGRRGLQIWDVRLRVECAEGGSLLAALRCTGNQLSRRAVPSRRYGVLLVQSYATSSGSLAMRLAPGMHGVVSLVRNRLDRARMARAARGTAGRTGHGSNE